MITFFCTCQHKFEVDDDQTGADIQCPKCGRLNSVPTAGDLALLNDDGTYKVDAPAGPEQENPELAAELGYIYQKSRIDEHGNEIDLRSHARPLDYHRVGVDPMDARATDQNRPPAPKYDPETGELIRPMDVSKEIAPKVRSALPAGRPNRKRHSVEQLTKVAPLSVLASLLSPPSMVVLAMIGAIHVLYGALIMAGTFLPFTILIPLFVLLALIAHHGNVIDETGPSSQDELPRPLRNLSWSDDLWGPFWAFMLAGIVCYGPAIFVLQHGLPVPKLERPVVGLMLAFGTFVAPAAILITQTSGSWVNLAPHRIMGTIRALWRVYPLLMLLYVISVPVYFIGLTYFTLLMNMLMAYFLSDIAHTARPRLPGWWVSGGIVLATLGGSFLLHYFGWVLGHVYRVYHKQLPWAYQGPLRENEGERRGFQVTPQPRKPKVAEKPPLAVIPVSERTKDRI